MGALHEGHISLIKRSKKFKLKTLVTIFVNPNNLIKRLILRIILKTSKRT